MEQKHASNFAVSIDRGSVFEIRSCNKNVLEQTNVPEYIEHRKN